MRVFRGTQVSAHSGLCGIPALPVHPFDVRPSHRDVALRVTASFPRGLVKCLMLTRLMLMATPQLGRKLRPREAAYLAQGQPPAGAWTGGAQVAISCPVSSFRSGQLELSGLEQTSPLMPC